MVLDYPNLVGKKVIFNDNAFRIDGYKSNISCVSIYSLERCIRTIIETNPDVTFKYVQYSERDNKVYFYTDKPIIRNSWYDSNNYNYSSPVNEMRFLSDVNKLLESDAISHNDCISLYDVFLLYQRRKQAFESVKNNLQNRINFKLINCERTKNLSVEVKSFDYESNELKFEIKNLDEYEQASVGVKNGKLQINYSHSPHIDYILKSNDLEIGRIFNLYKYFKKFNTQSVCQAYSVNSNFLISINKNYISISTTLKTRENFRLRGNNTTGEYECFYEPKESIITNHLKGYEDDLFSKIFIRIEDCPRWCRDELFELRQNELFEEPRTFFETLKEKLHQKDKWLSRN